MPGTFASTALLVTAGLVSCRTASRVALRPHGLRVAAILLRSLFLCLTLGLAMVFCVYLFDVYGYPGASIHYFKDGRLGSHALWLLFGGGLALTAVVWPQLKHAPFARFWPAGFRRALRRNPHIVRHLVAQSSGPRARPHCGPKGADNGNREPTLQHAWRRLPNSS